MHTRMETQLDQTLEWFKDMEREFQIHIPSDIALAIGATHNLSLKDRLVIALKNVRDTAALNSRIDELEGELEEGEDEEDETECENCKKLQEQLDTIAAIVS